MSQEARETKEYPEYCKQILLNLRESLIFQIYVTFSIDFPKYIYIYIYNDYLLAKLLIHFS